MAWECFWLVAFCFCLAGVMGLGLRVNHFPCTGQTPRGKAERIAAFSEGVGMRLARRGEGETPLRQAQGRLSRRPARCLGATIRQSRPRSALQFLPAFSPWSRVRTRLP